MSVYPIIAVASYLMGSIPFGYLLVRLFRGEDVRSGGSGNIGATNVARRSPLLGVTTLLLDAGKGLAAVVLARALSGGQPQKLVMTLAALCAVLGHLFPVWLKFRGGKGVATSFGSFALIAPKSVVCMVGLFLLIVAATRYVSMGSVVAAAAFPVLSPLFHEVDPVQLIPITLASLLVVWKHRQNIGRLMAGTESKLGDKRG
jgi:acyl phosphate:glycerol-3-phosphate acyltransferase